MAGIVFIQRTRFGRSIFTLRQDVLEISSQFGGTARIELRSISPDYSPGAESLLVPFAIVFLTGATSLWFAYRGIATLGWPELFGGFFAYVGLLLLGVSVPLLPRVDYYEFRNQWKNPLFVIIRESDQAEEADAFVRALLDRIEHPDAPFPDAAALASEPTETAEPPPHWWRRAIVAGHVALLYPPAASLHPTAREWSIVVVVVAGAFAAFAVMTSYSDKEPSRHWGLLGLALLLVPMFFY